MTQNEELLIRPLPLKKKLFFTLIVSVMAIALALLATEIAVRYASDSKYPTPATLKNRTLEYAPALFARHVSQGKN